jgi:hypothetical protein
VLFWFPLVPTGTFVVEKKRSLFSNKLTILRKLPLDWRQVRGVWGGAIGIVLSIIVALALLLHFL